jgi:hypothetical protein
MIEVMEKTLKLGHDACREGALHGLGHWKSGSFGMRIEKVIDQFLKQNPKLRPELRQYALNAQRGAVL